MENKVKTLYNLGKTHLVDSTAILASTNPIFAALENVALGMSDDVSIDARLFATKITYGGLGFVFSRGRDVSQKISKKLLRVKGEVSERFHAIHDTFYLIGFNAVVAPIMYSQAGAEPREILTGTLTAMAVSPLVGYISGYAIGAGRDLTGIQKSERIPQTIGNLNSKIKKRLAALAVAGLIGLNAAVYVATPGEPKEQSTIEQIQEISYHSRNLESNLI